MALILPSPPDKLGGEGDELEQVVCARSSVCVQVGPALGPSKLLSTSRLCTGAQNILVLSLNSVMKKTLLRGI